MTRKSQIFCNLFCESMQHYERRVPQTYTIVVRPWADPGIYNALTKQFGLKIVTVVSLSSRDKFNGTKYEIWPRYTRLLFRKN